nr:TMV resistance protein N-like isoform X3 [Quercus suber]XP_023920199.1 TMV resistance protein N-like isoform X3 [Quercus suber]
MSSISTQKASSLSSFSSTAPQWKYDVFLSFRGEDTRNSFTDHLYVALKQKGIVIFRDKEKLERGKSISPELLKAIEESRFVIVILSRNYASSTWCLDELVKIMECMKEMKTTVFPIFYDVDPTNVRKQTGTFAEAFSKHEEHFKDFIEKVQTWRAALREVANLNGWHLLDRSEAQFIQNIVGELWHKLSYAISEDIEDLVGIESQVKELESCLAIGSNDVRIIGLWGMGGIGKTTLARVVFHMVSEKFEGCCFLPNIREVCEKDGLIPLQQQLIRNILNESMSIQDVNVGVFVIKNRLRHKRILLVLDDVNQLDQLKRLVGKHNWFGSGSRVIITTRDKHLLHILGVDKIYEVEALNVDEALHLLSLKAFKKDHPPNDFLEMSKEVVHYANRLPLAIEILGSFLFSRDIDQWKSILNRLKEFPKREILQVLKLSFDGLDEVEKEIFLHIACFFNHGLKNDIIEKLDYLGLYPNAGLGVLIDKSLVKMDETIWMHDLLQEMGRNIVHQECPKDPGKRSKLWLFKDIDDVLTKNMETEAIQCVGLKLSTPEEAHWNPESFSKMPHLKLLIIGLLDLFMRKNCHMAKRQEFKCSPFNQTQEGKQPC